MSQGLTILLIRRLGLVSCATAWLNDDLTTVDQSMATPKASSELYHALSDVEVPSVRPPTIQCDPWCSAAVNRQVHSSDMLSRDHALAKCGVIILGDEDSWSHVITTCRRSSFKAYFIIGLGGLRLFLQYFHLRQHR